MCCCSIARNCLRTPLRVIELIKTSAHAQCWNRDSRNHVNHCPQSWYPCKITCDWPCGWSQRGRFSFSQVPVDCHPLSHSNGTSVVSWVWTMQGSPLKHSVGLLSRCLLATVPWGLLGDEMSSLSKSRLLCTFQTSYLFRLQTCRVMKLSKR